MKTGHHERAFLLIIAALVLAACAQPSPTPETGFFPENPVSSPLPSPGRSPISPLPQPGLSPLSPLAVPRAGEAAAAAVSFLAAELNIAPQTIGVLSTEPVDWPDTSLGCPRPGMMYAQMITPGYRFLLEARGETYEVHTDRSVQNAVICETTSGD
jgi:hypothetical protein